MVLKIPVRSIEKDTRVGFVAGIKFHHSHPDTVYPPQFAL
jgi:hypothetical protein